jgi:cold shock CspA family protein
MTVEVYTGRVKWFNSHSGFGFITLTDNSCTVLDNGADVFVHHSAIKVANEQYRYLVQGEYVDFSLVSTTEGPHKFQASNVSGIKGGQLMCETHRELKVARNNYQDTAKDTTRVSEEEVRSRRRRTSAKVRGEGPREGQNELRSEGRVEGRVEGRSEGKETSQWTYVVKKNSSAKPPANVKKQSSSKQVSQQRVV